MTIGQRIAQKRKEKGFSQEALGEMLGVSRQSVYKWESDAAVPEIDKFIAMSRLFDVTVGWLLGVEESGPAVRDAADTESKQTADDDGELTETQLRMVQEIVDRYIAAQSKRSASDSGEPTEAQRQMVQEMIDRYIAAQPKPPKRRRWPWVVGACAVIALVWALIDLSGKLDVLNSRYNNLQNSVSNVSTTVNSQINGIADRVEEVLQSQNSLLADYLVEISGADLWTNELFLSAKATPKTYTEGMEAAFIVDTGNGPVEHPATEGVGHQFTADITCDLTDTTTVSVVFSAGDTRETQIIYAKTYLYSSTFPTVGSVGETLMWKELDEDSTLRFNSNEYVHIRSDEYTSAMNGGVPVAKLVELKVGIFKNRELIAWLTPYEGVPANYVGFDAEEKFYQMPNMPILVEEEDVLCIATLVIDEYGRERLYSDTPYALNEDNELFWADDKIQEKEDWYDDTTWIY